nr:hypothetical protein [Tanacetum cinerariifolium]
MSTPTFAETHKFVAFLEKPAESAGFEKIIDFLKSKPIYYALTVNPTIYVSYFKQIWAKVKVKTVNDQKQIQALVDKTKVIITEYSIRSDLRLDGAEGTACLLNEVIFEGLACMSLQAMMDADRLLAKRLQAREREEFSKVQKVILLVELIEKIKKHFVALRAQEKRSKPPTKTQMKSQISKYLRHMGGYKQYHLKERIFDLIKELFNREMRKKQKVDEYVEPVVDDSKELRKCIEIVLDDGDEVLIEATPISSRSPTIIDYKIHKEGKMNYFKIIRDDGNSQVYQSFEKIFKNFNREDLDFMWAIVKEGFRKEKPVDDMDNILFRTPKTMYEHHVEDTI